MNHGVNISGTQQMTGEGMLDEANPEGMPNVNGNPLLYFSGFHNSE